MLFLAVGPTLEVALVLDTAATARVLVLRRILVHARDPIRTAHLRTTVHYSVIACISIFRIHYRRTNSFRKDRRSRRDTDDARGAADGEQPASKNGDANDKGGSRSRSRSH